MPNVLGTLQIIVIEKFQLIFTLCAEEKRNIENIKLILSAYKQFQCRLITI